MDANHDDRLLLSNADLGVPLMALDLQAGMDFEVRPIELFKGKEMGEDAMRLLEDYRNEFRTIRKTVSVERISLRESFSCDKSLGLGG